MGGRVDYNIEAQKNCSGDGTVPHSGGLVDLWLCTYVKIYRDIDHKDRILLYVNCLTNGQDIRRN